MAPYDTSLQHILAELERIDLLVQVQVWRARQLNEADEQFQGLVITEQEVDALLAAPAGLPRWAMETAPLALPDVRAALDQLAAGIRQRKAASAHSGIALRLDTLAHLFELTPFDVDALLICLAPELDLRYERFYSYLQDDVTKKRPSVDLVLNLLSPSFAAKLALRQRFTEAAPLIKHRLLYLFDDPSNQQPPLLSRYLKPDERVVRYLLDQDDIDPRLHAYARHAMPQASLEELLLPEAMKQRLTGLVHTRNQADGELILYLQGPYGVGKESTAAALCRELGLGLLVVDGEKLLHAEDLAFETAVHLVIREVRLQHAALYWAGFDALLEDERRAWREMLWQALSEGHGLTFLAGNAPWEPSDVQGVMSFVRVELTRPAAAQRIQLWTRFLDGNTPQGHGRGPGRTGHQVSLYGRPDQRCGGHGPQPGPLARSGGRPADAGRPAHGLPAPVEPQAGHAGTQDHTLLCLGRHRPARGPPPAIARDLQPGQTPVAGVRCLGV